VRPLALAIQPAPEPGRPRGLIYVLSVSQSMSIDNVEDLEDFVAVVVDHLDGDLAGFG
jgi:hypothetical protein